MHNNDSAPLQMRLDKTLHPLCAAVRLGLARLRGYLALIFTHTVLVKTRFTHPLHFADFFAMTSAGITVSWGFVGNLKSSLLSRSERNTLTLSCSGCAKYFVFQKWRANLIKSW